jgi:general secretion pathway protein K
MSVRHSPKPQQGVALIVVLLLLAIMTAIAATMSERLGLTIDRAANQNHSQQAYWYAMGVESLAKFGIEESVAESDTVNLSQPWAIENQIYPLDYGQATGQIRDMQACFNLNALSGLNITGSELSRPLLLNALKLLLEQVGTESYSAEVIADSAYEYISESDRVTTLAGVGEGTYEALQPSYLNPNTFIADLFELRAMQNVTPQVMRQVQSLVCAIPTDKFQLNVNTLMWYQAPLLVALFDMDLDIQQAEDLIDNRPYDGWESVDAFLAETTIAALEKTLRDKVKPYLSVESQYFELDTEVEVENARVRLRSLLFLDNAQQAHVLRRRFGGIIERVSDRTVE